MGSRGVWKRSQSITVLAGVGMVVSVLAVSPAGESSPERDLAGFPASEESYSAAQAPQLAAPLTLSANAIEVQRGYVTVKASRKRLRSVTVRLKRPEFTQLKVCAVPAPKSCAKRMTKSTTKFKTRRVLTSRSKVKVRLSHPGGVGRAKYRVTPGKSRFTVIVKGAADTSPVIPQPPAPRTPPSPSPSPSQSAPPISSVCGQPVPPSGSDSVGTNRTFQAVYLTTSEETRDRTAAISHTVAAVARWYCTQLPQKTIKLRGGDSPTVVTIRDTQQHQRALNSERELAREWKESGVIPADSVPVIFLEGGREARACGWAQPLEYFETLQHWSWMIVMPMDRCEIYPDTQGELPRGATYLTAHEIGHTLGGKHSYVDRRDLLYMGGGRDWQNLRLSTSEVASMIDSPLFHDVQ